MSEWVRAALGDLISVKHGFAFAGSEFSTNSEMPTLVTPGNFAIGGGFTHAKIKTFSGSVPAEYLLAPRSVVVTMTDLSKQGDTLGYSAKIPQSGRYLHNQRIGLVETRKPEKLSVDYAYYLLQTPRYRQHILASATGSTVRHTSPSRIYDYKFGLPPLDEQRRIAEVLGALDDLIDTNRRLISQLVALFDAASRRVALQSSSTEILGSKAALTKGVSYQGKFLSSNGLPLINLASFSRSGSFVEQGTKYYTGPVPPKKLLSRGDLVVANTDLTQERLLLGRPMLVRHEAASSTHHTFQVAVDDRLDRLWVFSLLRDEARRAGLASFATGTTVTALPSDALNGLEVPWPSRPALREWAETIEPLLETAWAIEDECETLRRTRDELLPLLMSGAVRVRPEGVSV